MGNNITSKDIINEWLPVFDNHLANSRVNLQERPFRAAILFVKHALVEIEGYDKEKYLDTPWFVAFLNYINDWYKYRYGDLLKNDLNLKGLIFLNDYPIETKFPYSKRIKVDKEDQFAMVFLGNYKQNIENWQEYVYLPPYINESNDTELLKNSVIADLERHRILFHNINSIDKSSKEVRSLSGGIFGHIDNAVNCILESTKLSRNYNLAFWDFHMVIEKILKILLIQNNMVFPKTHDVFKLFSDLYKNSHGELSRKLKKLPTHREIISIRYGEPQIVDIEAAKVAYENAMDILFELSKNIKQTFNANGLTVYMKKPKYAGAKLVD